MAQSARYSSAAAKKIALARALVGRRVRTTSGTAKVIGAEPHSGAPRLRVVTVPGRSTVGGLRKTIPLQAVVRNPARKPKRAIAKAAKAKPSTTTILSKTVTKTRRNPSKKRSAARKRAIARMRAGLHAWRKRLASAIAPKSKRKKKAGVSTMKKKRRHGRKSAARRSRRVVLVNPRKRHHRRRRNPGPMGGMKSAVTDAVKAAIPATIGGAVMGFVDAKFLANQPIYIRIGAKVATATVAALVLRRQPQAAAATMGAILGTLGYENGVRLAGGVVAASKAQGMKELAAMAAEDSEAMGAFVDEMQGISGMLPGDPSEVTLGELGASEEMPALGDTDDIAGEDDSLGDFGELADLSGDDD